MLEKGSACTAGGRPKNWPGKGGGRGVGEEVEDRREPLLIFLSLESKGIEKSFSTALGKIIRGVIS